MDFTSVPVHQFYTFLLIFMRLAGLLSVAPLLGSRVVPHNVKAGLTFLFAMAITPMVEPKTGPIPVHLLALVGQITTEAMFGVALGYMARLLFSAVEMAGYLADTQMGFGFVNLIDPFSEHQTSLMSVFQYQLSLTIYLLANGHLLLLGALVESLNTLPAGSVSPNAGFGLTIAPMLRVMFVLGLQIALPAMGVLMVVDVAFGLVARLVPQVNVFIVGTPAKIILGMMTVALTLPSLASVIGQVVAGTTTGLNALLAGAK